RARARAGRWAGRAPRSLDDGPRCAAATTRPTHTRKGYGHEDRRSRSPAVRPGHLAGTRLRRAGRRGGGGTAGTGGRGDHRVARVLGTADALSPSARIGRPSARTVVGHATSWIGLCPGT